MKRFSIVFSSFALKDIDEAVEYYNQLAFGLGNKFIADFKLVYNSIKLNPLFAAIKYENVRCAAFKRFPFSIHYTVDKRNKIVTIVAVFNIWKKPFW